MMPYGKFPRWIADDGLSNRLGKSATRVLLQMVVLINGKSFEGRVGIDRLSERCGMSRRLTLIGVKELVDTGILEYSHKTGEYRFLGDDAAQTDCADAQTDCADAKENCADRANRLRDSRKQIAPLPTIDQELSTKNSYQEGEPVCESDGLIPYKDKRIDPTTIGKSLLDSVGYPSSYSHRNGETTIIAHALYALADGAEGEQAASDPVTWLALRLKDAADKRHAKGDEFVPYIRNWFEKNYPHLIEQGQPFGYGGRVYR